MKKRYIMTPWTGSAASECEKYYFWLGIEIEDAVDYDGDDPDEGLIGGDYQVDALV